MIDQILSLLQGPQAVFVAIFFFCLDVSALSVIMRIILSKIVPACERASVIDLEQKRRINEASTLAAPSMLLFVLAHAVILYWGSLHIPKEIFLALTLGVIFLCYIFFAAPIVLVLIKATQLRIERIEREDEAAFNKAKDEIWTMCISLANATRFISYMFIIMSIAVMLLHMNWHEQLLAIK